MFLSALKDWSAIIACFLAGILLAGLWTFHNSKVEQAILEGRGQVIQEYSSDYVNELQESVASLKRLNEEASKENEKLRNENSRIDNERQFLIDRLRERPTREEASRSASSVSPETASSCTGRELYREDGEFLAGEAARADKLIVERDYYYNMYEKARQEVEYLKQRIQDGKD